MDIPKKERTFLVDFTGTETGFKYYGNVTVKSILSIGDRIQVEVQRSVIKSELNNPSPALESYAIILSALRVRIVDAPDWWKNSNGGMNIDDEDFIAHLYNKVMDQEDAWRAELKKQAGEATQGNS